MNLAVRIHVCGLGDLGPETPVRSLGDFVRIVVAQFLVAVHLEIFWRHADHGGFLLFGVEVLNNTAVGESLPCDLVFRVVWRVLLLVTHLVDESLLENKVALFDDAGGTLLDDENGPHDTAGIGENLEFTVTNVAYQ